MEVSLLPIYFEQTASDTNRLVEAGTKEGGPPNLTRAVNKSVAGAM
jgi:hypothetical protein